MKRIILLVVILAFFVPLQTHAQDVKKDPPQKFVVPFELIKTQHMVIKVKINGKGPYRLVFDTGAPFGLVSNKVAKEAGVFSKDFKAPLFAFFGSMGEMKIKELEVGDLKVNDISTMVMDHPTVKALSQFVDGPLEGIIGFTFYARYKMSIDYEKKQLTFEPGTFEPPGNVMKALMDKMSAPKTALILAPAGLLGIRVEKMKDDEEAGVSVKDVLPDSPAAAAGLKVGDRLLTLDGRWTDSVNDCYIAAGHLRTGTAAPLEVMRDGKKLTLKMTVRAGL